MLQEMNITDALKRYLKGKQILVMHDTTLKPGNPEYAVETLDSLLDGVRFLVDVPAVPSPDFEEATVEMTAPKEDAQPTEEPTKKRRGRPKQAVKDAPGKRCATCKYRETTADRGNCNYLAITGHSRGCDAEDCTVYVEGDPGKRTVPLSLS